MASTVVYGCDWCKEVVEKDRQDKPRYAARVTVDELRSIGQQTVTEEICADCRKNLQALREGKVRRVG